MDLSCCDSELLRAPGRATQLPTPAARGRLGDFLLLGDGKIRLGPSELKSLKERRSPGWRLEDPSRGFLAPRKWKDPSRTLELKSLKERRWRLLSLLRWPTATLSITADCYSVAAADAALAVALLAYYTSSQVDTLLGDYRTGTAGHGDDQHHHGRAAGLPAIAGARGNGLEHRRRPASPAPSSARPRRVSGARRVWTSWCRQTESRSCTAYLRAGAAVGGHAGPVQHADQGQRLRGKSLSQ